MITRSLDKIIVLERAAARREYGDLRERLFVFETRYQISSGNTTYERTTPVCTRT